MLPQEQPKVPKAPKEPEVYEGTEGSEDIKVPKALQVKAFDAFGTSDAFGTFTG
jgi:ribosomal protein L13